MGVATDRDVLRRQLKNDIVEHLRKERGAPTPAAIILSSMDNDASRRNAMRTEFFGALADRIRFVRQSHIECDTWIAREHKRQLAAARRAVSWTKENKRLKARVAELEAELVRRSITWPRAVGE
jgi:hypothetical protein